MDLPRYREKFESILTMNKAWDLRIQRAADSAMEAIQQALVELQPANNNEGSSSSSHPPHHQMATLAWLWLRLRELAPQGIFLISRVPSDIIRYYVRWLILCDHYSNMKSISKTWRDVEWDTHTVDGIIACHLYREGLFDAGDCFVREAHLLPNASAFFRSPFEDLHLMLGAMRSGDLGPALNWAASHRTQLLQKGSYLEMKLHGRRCLEDTLEGVRGAEALAYAKANLAPFASLCRQDFRMLACCLLLYAGRVERSPYASLIGSMYPREKLAEELTQQFCGLMGQAARSPLRVAVAAGALALAAVVPPVNALARSWEPSDDPPELSDDLVFHSCVVCPLTLELCTDEDPPMLLPCGHVLSYNGMMGMVAAGPGPIKCTHRCGDFTIGQCLRLQNLHR